MKALQMLSGLVVGSRDTASMGRVLLWLFVVLAVYFWLCRPPEAFPSSLEFAMASALAYNLGGKAVNKFGAMRGPDREDL